MEIIKGRDLPELGWIGGDTLRRDKFRPVTVARTDRVSIATKPYGTGLWCSPTRRAGLRQQVIGTAWSLRESGGADVHTVTLVHPEHGSKAVVIDSHDDLIEAIGRWPDQRRPRCEDDAALRPEPQPYLIHWPNMARDVDVFYLTPKGLEETSYSYPVDLAGWDVPTAFFLRPAFKVGATVQTVPASLWRRWRRTEVETEVQQELDAAVAQGELPATKEQMDHLRKLILIVANNP